MPEEQQLLIALKKLALKIISEVFACLQQGAIQPEIELYYRGEVEEFDYTPQGSIQTKIAFNPLNKPIWRKALKYFNSYIVNFDDYREILELYNQVKPEDLESFSDKIIIDFLYSKLDDDKINYIIDIFLKEINQEPIIYTLEICLEGLFLQGIESIDFKDNTFNLVLRKTKTEDLEKEFPYYNFNQTSTEIPSAILSIVSYEDSPLKRQALVYKSVAILRLFKPGSVDYISFSTKCEAITQRARLKVGGVFSKNKSIIAPINSFIYQEDEQNLKCFWKAIAKVLPESFYSLEKKELNHLLIAYNRYCDALLRRLSTLEERVTNAIIGLESLLLCENVEISFRFRIRGAKILSFLGYSALEVKDALNLGYEIRSAFVHGDDIKLEKSSKKLSNKYLEKEDFLLKILEYLRILIVITFFLLENEEFAKQKNGKIIFLKEDFLKLVDDSLIDKIQEDRLITILNLASSRVSEV